MNRLGRLLAAYANSRAVREGGEVTYDGQAATVLGVDGHGTRPLVSVRLASGGVIAAGLGDVQPVRRRAERPERVRRASRGRRLSRVNT